MESKGLNKLGKLVDSSGETVMEMLGPPNALTEGADGLSRGIYVLSETVVRGLMPDKRGGFLGGEFGYAAEYENSVFRLYPDYQDDPLPDAPAFNFRHHGSGLEVCWYKWIGRDMKINRDSLSSEEWVPIFKECWESIPLEARQKAEAEHDYEHTPEYLAAQKEGMARMFEVLSNPEKYNAPFPEVECYECQKKETLPERSWTTPMLWMCDGCRSKKPPRKKR